VKHELITWFGRQPAGPMMYYNVWYMKDNPTDPKWSWAPKLVTEKIKKEAWKNAQSSND
jgi:hypothetical protein